MGLDVVEILMGWERAFEISISDDEAVTLRTPRAATDLIARKLAATDSPSQACFTLRAFHRLRTSIASVTSVNRQRIRPSARLKDLVARQQWDAIRSNCGIASLPNPGWFSPRTVADLTRWTVIHASKTLKPASEPWTRAEIRSIVRAVVTDATGIDKFGDDDDFIHVMGID
jgi:hypothetical protein